MKQSLLKHALLTALCVCIAGTLFSTLSPSGTAHASNAQAASCYLYAVTYGTGYNFSLGYDQAIVTCSGNALQFSYQKDNNVVLYCNGNAIWATGTDIPWWSTNFQPDRASFQSDGNFVVYELDVGTGERAAWASNTNNRGAEMLVLQRDGNLVIYQGGYTHPLWASGTYGRC